MMTKDEFLAKKMGINFKKIWSKEKWFFIVWNWSIEQKWWDEFLVDSIFVPSGFLSTEKLSNIIHPDRFSNTVAKHLGWKEVKHEKTREV
jgi:hypothetical protein